MRKVLVLLSCCLWATTHARGAQGPFTDSVIVRPRSIYTIEEGLPQNSVKDLVQTRDGALWIATYGGLARHTGTGFETWSLRNTPELGSNFVCSLLEDRDGMLWVGSAEGTVARLDARSLPYELQGFGPAQGVPNGRVADMVQLRDGTVVMGSEDTVTKFENGRFIPMYAEHVPQPRAARRLHVDVSGRLWCASADGLWRLDTQQPVLTSWTDGRACGSASYVDEHPQHGLWCYTDEGFALVKPTGLQALSHAGEPPRTFHAFSAVLNEDGGIVIGTGYSTVLVRLDERTATQYPSPLQGLHSTALLHDRDGNLWVGSQTSGLMKLVRSFSWPFEGSTLRLKEGQLLFAPADRDDAWVASSEAEQVLRFHTPTATVQAIAPLPTGLGRVQALLTGRDGTLHVLFAQGLVSAKGGVERRVALASQIYTGSLCEDAEGYIWVGDRGRVHRVGGTSAQPELTTYGAEAGLPEDAEIAALRSDAANRVWLGTSRGLACWSAGRITMLGAAEGYSGGSVRAILPLEDGTIWAGLYGGGLVRLRNSQAVRVDASQGLYDNFVSNIQMDDEGALWINSNRGVFRVRLADLEAVADGRLDAVPCLAGRTNEGNGMSGVRLASGRLLFPTVRGFAMVDPARMTDTNQPPGIELREVVADGRSHRTRADITVPPGPRELVFRFAALAWTEPQAVRYRYRLQGFDTDWRAAGSEAFARYTNVPPGRYRFEVHARSYDGSSSPEPAGIGLDLEPYVHETWWFRLSALGAVLVGIGYAFRRRAQTARKRHNELQHEVHLRQTAEDSLRGLHSRLVRAQEEERRRIARDLHDDLGQRLALVGVRLDVMERSAQTEGATPVASELAALSQSVKSISSDVHGLSVQLHSAQLDTLGLRSALRSLCKEVSQQHELAIEYEVTGEGAEPREDLALGLYRIAQEALRNALRHSEASSIRLELQLESRFARLVVVDDGCGFDPQQVTSSKSLGLRGMQERLRILGGQLYLTSASGRGTRLEAIVPLEASPAA